MKMWRNKERYSFTLRNENESIENDLSPLSVDERIAKEGVNPGRSMRVAERAAGYCLLLLPSAQIQLILQRGLSKTDRQSVKFMRMCWACGP